MKRYRVIMGLTQEQVAETLGIAHNTYVRYENDLRRPTTENALKLSLFYHVSIGQLMYGEQPAQPDEASSAQTQKECDGLLDGLTAAELQRVRDFIEGLKAARSG